MVGFIVYLGFGIILAWLGYLVQKKHLYWLITGYNMMSESQQAKVDIQKVGILVGKMTYLLALLLVSAGCCFLVKQQQLAMVLTALMFPVIIYAIVQAQHYDGNTKNPNGTYKKSSLFFTGAIVFLLILTALLILLSLF